MRARGPANRVVVLGANGALGRAVIARLGERPSVGEPIDVIGLDGHADPDEGLLPYDGVRIVVDATGRVGSDRQAVGRAVVAIGAHLVDPTPAQPHVRWLTTDLDSAARGRGTTVVAAGGLAGGLGELLGLHAATATTQCDAIHVAYLVADRGLRGRATAGGRAAAVSLLGRPGLAFVDGKLEPEWIGEARRLAWFARPVGPHHAAGVPGAEALLLPATLTTLRTVRSYVAIKTARAELLQLAGNAARWEPVRRRMQRLVLGSPDDGPARRRGASTPVVGEGARWAVVAEAHGTDGVARAWANGRGVHVTTAAVVGVAIDRLLDGWGARASGRPVGTVGLASLLDPAVVLDRLGGEVGLRWSVIRPDDEVSASVHRR